MLQSKKKQTLVHSKNSLSLSCSDLQYGFVSAPVATRRALAERLPETSERPVTGREIFDRGDIRENVVREGVFTTLKRCSFGNCLPNHHVSLMNVVNNVLARTTGNPPARGVSSHLPERLSTQFEVWWEWEELYAH